MKKAVLCFILLALLISSASAWTRPYNITISQTATRINVSVEVTDYEIEPPVRNDTNYTYIVLPEMPTTLEGGTVTNWIPIDVRVDYNGTTTRLRDVNFTTTNQSLGTGFALPDLGPAYMRVGTRSYIVTDIPPLPEEKLLYSITGKDPKGFTIHFSLNPVTYNEETTEAVLFKWTNITIDLEPRPPQPDVKMERMTTPIARLGENFDVTLLSVENRGELNATVTCREILPSVLVLVSGNTSWSGDLTPAKSTYYTYTVNVQNVQGEQFYNITTVCTYTDPQNQQYTSEEISKISLYSPPEITIRRTAETSVKANKEAQVTITVTNVGLTRAHDMNLNDDLPPELTVTNGSITLTIEQLEPSQSETLNYTFKAPAVDNTTKFAGTTTVSYNDLASFDYTVEEPWSVEISPTTTADEVPVAANETAQEKTETNKTIEQTDTVAVSETELPGGEQAKTEVDQTGVEVGETQPKAGQTKSKAGPETNQIVAELKKISGNLQVFVFSDPLLLGGGIAAIVLLGVGGYFAYAQLSDKKALKEQSKVTAEVKSGVLQSETSAQPGPLDQYINTCIKTGFSREQIRSNLVSAGWDETIVDTELTKFFSSNTTLKSIK